MSLEEDQNWVRKDGHSRQGSSMCRRGRRSHCIHDHMWVPHKYVSNGKSQREYEKTSQKTKPKD